jgi:cellulose synthase/poly-beta-1,6-N-acetylglucosamine synthase-like glycosyltransferase
MIVSQILRITGGVLFAIMFAYRVVYIIISMFVRQRPLKKKVKYRKYAVVSCARNEEEVIGQLIDSIKKQTYPSEYIDIFVMADNCDDNTALVSRQAGAIVYERFNKEQVGKGYALDALFNHMMEDGYDDYDGYFVFDSDNILSTDYIDKMNRFYKDEYDAVSSNRQSKNYADNWISAGYGITYLREMRLLNYPRQIVGSCASISGTGFMINPRVIKENHGWKYFLLTEDTEFYASRVLAERRVGYNADAIFYDEQPTGFGQSWTQRMRWTKGYFQVLGSKGWPLCKKVFSKKGFWAWDLLCSMIPGFVLAISGIVADSLEFGSRIIHHMSLVPFITTALFNTLAIYAGAYVLGFIVTMLEWKRIKASAKDKLLFTISFPAFLATFVPISVAALFKRVKWDPIKHNKVESIDEFE